jgi:hypothetical protein
MLTNKRFIDRQIMTMGRSAAGMACDTCFDSRVASETSRTASHLFIALLFPHGGIGAARIAGALRNKRTRIACT